MSAANTNYSFPSEETLSRLERKRPFSVNEFIILNNKWRLDEKERSSLDSYVKYYCSLETFLAHVKRNDLYKWKWDFICEGSKLNNRFTKLHRYSINFFFCSMEYLEYLSMQWEEKTTVSFIVRRNSANNFYSLLVKINYRDWQEENLGPTWYKFPRIS